MEFITAFLVSWMKANPSHYLMQKEARVSGASLQTMMLMTLQIGLQFRGGLAAFSAAFLSLAFPLIFIFSFAFTGFMGYTLGPLLNMVLSGYSNGAQLVMTAFGLTGMIFLGLSGYALTTRKEFNYLGGFLFAAGLLGLIASIIAVFFHMPLMYLGVCALFVLISSGFILFETSQIIHGGERNYIMATISLYVSIYNLFVSLLQLLMIFAGRRD